jgi:hypothetical protein
MQLNQNYINVVFFVLFLIIFALYFNTNQNENLTNISNESLQNLSSVYNNGVLRVNRIETTGDVSVGGTATFGRVIADTSKIGKWEIRDDIIGIKDRGNIMLTEEKWVKLMEWGAPAWGRYAGQDTIHGGFEGANISAHHQVRSDTLGVRKQSDFDGDINVRSGKMKLGNWNVYSQQNPVDGTAVGHNWSGKNGGVGNEIFRIDSPGTAKFEIDTTGLFGTPSKWGNKGFF